MIEGAEMVLPTVFCKNFFCKNVFSKDLVKAYFTRGERKKW
jgi:hypothetical protein